MDAKKQNENILSNTIQPLEDNYLSNNQCRV